VVGSLGIKYKWGHISVLDHAALEERVWDCDVVVKEECDRLLPARPLSSARASVHCRTDLGRPAPLQDVKGWREARDPEPGAPHDHRLLPSHPPTANAEPAESRPALRERCARRTETRARSYARPPPTSPTERSTLRLSKPERCALAAKGGVSANSLTELGERLLIVRRV
jgi:hypothetical protein